MGPTAASGVRHARSATQEEGNAPKRGSDTTPQYADKQ
jgi:hypothetical protein